MGDEAFYNNWDVSGFSVKTTSPVSVLEIGREDFRDKMPPEIMA